LYSKASKPNLYGGASFVQAPARGNFYQYPNTSFKRKRIKSTIPKTNSIKKEKLSPRTEEKTITTKEQNTK
jgi:hypothetical protein